MAAEVGLKSNMSATTAALGARLKTHPADKPKYWLIPLGLAIAAGGLFAMLGPWLWPDPRAGLGTAIGVSILGLLLTALGVFSVASVFMGRDRAVHLYEHGIVEQRGNTQNEMLWDDVATLTCQRVRVTQAGGLVSQQLATYILKTATGRKIIANNRLAEVLPLGEAIEEHVTRCLLPKVRAQLAKGERVAFSPLVVTNQRIERGKKALAWEQVVGAEVAQGEVRIFARGEPTAWTKVQYGSLTNAQALLSLISSRVKSES
jgi:hypothetical protein